MRRAITNVLDRWAKTAKPGSWRDKAVYAYIYAIVVYQKTKWGLVRYLPARLQVRCLLGK
jgi:hypothetical protein